VNARGAPNRVVAAHFPNQFPDSWETGGRPGCPRRTFLAHNRRSPLRCQAITVSGFGMRVPSATRPTFHKTKPTASGQTGSVSASSRSAAARQADGEARLTQGAMPARVRQTDRTVARNADNTAVEQN
jgi:hypothetical protein